MALENEAEAPAPTSSTPTPTATEIRENRNAPTSPPEAAQVGERKEKVKAERDAANLVAEDGPTIVKKQRVVTSKILGLANPRKPRIGRDYQADIPEQTFRLQAFPLSEAGHDVKTEEGNTEVQPSAP